MTAALRKIWIDSGRPGVEKLYAAAKREGLDVKRAAVSTFIKAQETRQIFAPAPRSTGKVTSTGIDSRWQVDLIDFKQMEATKNNGYRLVLVVSDVFSRFVWAVPIKDKSQKAVAAAFKGIIDTGRKPAEVDSDGGAEFTGLFDALLEEKGIAHRTKNPKQINAIAVVDGVVKKLKDTIRQEMAKEGTGK